KMAAVSLTESGSGQPEAGQTVNTPDSGNPQTAIGNPHFQSLDAFRPILARSPEPQVMEAQRREFFAQLHRWSRQDYAVHLFCNNEGERQRLAEIWNEYGFD